MPVSVALKLSFSLDPAVVDLIENVPLTLRVPFAPANLPVPLVTVALPVTETVVGAAESAAQAFEVVASVRCSVEPPPLRVPVPLIGSQVLVGADDPVPLTAARGAAFESEWNQRFGAYEKQHPQLAREFLRRMVSPLVIVNTYVPLLPLQLIDAVDAPFPYLLGTNTRLLKENILDLSDTVVVDLDTRIVIPRVNKSTRPDNFASVNLMAKLTQEVSDILLLPLGDWFHRPTDRPAAASPFSEAAYITRAARVLQVFKRATLDLICARNCSVKAFWRRSAESSLQATPAVPMSVAAAAADARASAMLPANRKPGATMMGFNYQDGVCSGFMQLAKELHDDNEHVSHFTPCWVEMDQYVLSVYQHADDLPILYVLLKDIETVSPCAIEPEGHVFEMIVKDQMSYRFTVTDTESRQKWISTIDRRKSMDFSGTNDDQAMLDQNFSNKMRALELSEHVSIDASVSLGPGGGGSAALNGGAPAVTALWNGFELITKPVAAPVPATPTPAGKAAKEVDPATEDASGSNHGPTVGSTITLGFPQQCPLGYADSAALLAKEDSLFRFEFSRTQTMNYIHQQVECKEFQEVFKDLKIKSETLIGPTYSLDSNLNIVPSATLQQARDAELDSQSTGGGSGPISRNNSDGALDSAGKKVGGGGGNGEDAVSPLARSNTLNGAGVAAEKPDMKRRISSKMFGGFFNKKPSPEVIDPPMCGVYS